jgi:hypothetical protein
MTANALKQNGNLVPSMRMRDAIIQAASRVPALTGLEFVHFQNVRGHGLAVFYSRSCCPRPPTRGCYDRCAYTFFSAICIAATVIFWLGE